MTPLCQTMNAIYAKLGGFDARRFSLREVRDAAIKIELEATGYNYGQTAKNLGVTAGFITSWIRRQRTLAKAAACLMAVALVGCAGNRQASKPPLPMPSAARSVAANRVDSSLAIAPPAPAKHWIFKWDGPTNGWVHVVGRKDTLLSPWQEFARVTNRTECPVTPGFYTILRMEDTDLPGHVWVRR